MQTPQILDDFVAECVAALATDDARATIHRALGALVAPGRDLASHMPAFAADEVATSPCGHRLGGEHIVHQSPDLTVMVLDTLPGVIQPPHDHNMPAFIGVFEGGEAQRYWARTDAGIVPSGEQLLEAGDVLAIGSRGIHAISAPGDAARAVHVYLGDIYDIDRSVFHPDTLEEFDMTSDRYDEFCRPASVDA